MPVPISPRRRRASSERGATVAAVATMRSALPPSVGVKASGGIRSRHTGSCAAGGRRARGWAPVRRLRSSRRCPFMPSLDRQISETPAGGGQAAQRPTAGRARSRGREAPADPSVHRVGGRARRSRSFCGRVSRTAAEVLDEASRPGSPGSRSTPTKRCADTAPATSLPVLHRGLLVDAYQLYEARLDGAHGVVLIAEALDDDDGLFHDSSRWRGISAWTWWCRSRAKTRSRRCSTCSIPIRF